MRTPERPGARVERELRDRIKGMTVGQQLPPVGDLADAHKTSRATVTRIMHKLADEGLLTITPGWGTFIADPDGSADSETDTEA